MDSKTYKVVGISTTPAGITKVRFAQDLVSRIKTLVMRGHTDVKLLETPQAMNKQGCLTWLKSQPGFDTPHETVGRPIPHTQPSGDSDRSHGHISKIERSNSSCNASGGLTDPPEYPTHNSII